MGLIKPKLVSLSAEALRTSRVWSARFAWLLLISLVLSIASVLALRSGLFGMVAALNSPLFIVLMLWLAIDFILTALFMWRYFYTVDFIHTAAFLERMKEQELLQAESAKLLAQQHGQTQSLEHRENNKEKQKAQEIPKEPKDSCGFFAPYSGYDDKRLSPKFDSFGQWKIPILYEMKSGKKSFLPLDGNFKKLLTQLVINDEICEHLMKKETLMALFKLDPGLVSVFEEAGETGVRNVVLENFRLYLYKDDKKTTFLKALEFAKAHYNDAEFNLESALRRNSAFRLIDSSDDWRVTPSSPPSYQKIRISYDRESGDCKISSEDLMRGIGGILEELQSANNQLKINQFYNYLFRKKVLIALLKLGLDAEAFEKSYVKPQLKKWRKTGKNSFSLPQGDQLWLKNEDVAKKVEEAWTYAKQYYNKRDPKWAKETGINWQDFKLKKLLEQHAASKIFTLVPIQKEEVVSDVMDEKKEDNKQDSKDSKEEEKNSNDTENNEDDAKSDSSAIEKDTNNTGGGKVSSVSDKKCDTGNGTRDKSTIVGEQEKEEKSLSENELKTEVQDPLEFWKNMKKLLTNKNSRIGVKMPKEFNEKNGGQKIQAGILDQYGNLLSALKSSTDKETSRIPIYYVSDHETYLYFIIDRTLLTTLIDIIITGKKTKAENDSQGSKSVNFFKDLLTCDEHSQINLLLKLVSKSESIFNYFENRYIDSDSMCKGKDLRSAWENVKQDSFGWRNMGLKTLLEVSAQSKNFILAPIELELDGLKDFLEKEEKPKLEAQKTNEQKKAR